MILFVCRGNMFRSPVAKALYNVRKISGSRAESAGLWVEREHHVGVRLCDMEGAENSIGYMRQKQIDISNEIGIQLTEDMVEKAERVYVMAEKEIWPDYLKNNPKAIVWEVENPDTTNPADARRVGDLIDSLVKTI